MKKLSIFVSLFFILLFSSCCDCNEEKKESVVVKKTDIQFSHFFYYGNLGGSPLLEVILEAEMSNGKKLKADFRWLTIKARFEETLQIEKSLNEGKINIEEISFVEERNANTLDWACFREWKTPNFTEDNGIVYAYYTYIVPYGHITNYDLDGLIGFSLDKDPGQKESLLLEKIKNGLSSN